MPGALKNRDTILEDIVANLRSSQPGVGCLGWWWGLKTCSSSPSVSETETADSPGRGKGRMILALRISRMQETGEA